MAKRIPRGIRNNNPLNIRHVPNSSWQGQVGNDGAFCVFLSMEYGFRAAFRLLHTYNKKYHLYSVEDIINRWAPPSDGNNTESYIKRVCNSTGLKKTSNIDIRNSWELSIPLVMAMAEVECGCHIERYNVEIGYCLAFPEKKVVQQDFNVDDVDIDYLGILPNKKGGEK